MTTERRRAASLVVALAIAACSHHQGSQLEDDVGQFCRAWEAHGKPQRIGELAEDLAQQIKSPELLDAFASIAPDGDSHVFERLHAIVRQVGVTSCPTLDWMEKKYGAPRDAAPLAPTLVFALSAHGGATVSNRGGPPSAVVDAELDARLRAAFMRDHETEIVVIGEPSVTFQRAADLLDRARMTGLSHVAIGVDAADVYELDTPHARPSNDDVLDGLVIRLRPSGDLAVHGKAITEAALDDLLRAEAARVPQEAVVVVADRPAPVDRIVAILARVRRAGVTRFRLGVGARP